ncbi:hypothetical protein CTAYLR_006318 [Chrysophaeum taylorii]|uniref:Exostosin GT47 domain-containing protein n=1 Tax=Chrysophaeum taylorii TaxID=2483200 RepID=A0AAD7XJT6_9STRA|nr:hypothetical protein CTAYLR_006318 [Chrysophaeum taylorii]
MKESTIFRLFWCLVVGALVVRVWSVVRSARVELVDDDDEIDEASPGVAHAVENIAEVPKKVKIYIYELGPRLQPWLNDSENIGQYSLGSVMFERMIVDSRRTRDPSKATLYVVPVDLSRMTFGDDKLPPHEICALVAEARRRVEAVKKPRTRFFGEAPVSYASRRNGLDHVVPVARVASSMYWGWGKSCADTFNWLRSMQWVTIEPPYRVDAETGEAVVDHSDIPPMGGAPRHHIVPYTTGVRFRSRDDAELLRRYQRSANRTYLVAQSIGDHARKGSSLRSNLKVACARLSPGICATDWRAARALTLQRNRKTAGPLKHFEQWLVHSTPHVALYASATFCVQPPGVTPTRTAVYQCLLAGSIPVFFESFLVDALNPLFSPAPLVTTSVVQQQEKPFQHTPSKGDDDWTQSGPHPWAVVVSTKRATANPFAEVYGKLARMDRDVVDDMRRTIAQAAPRLQYALPGANIAGDAYDYAIARAVITANNAIANAKDL